jgi:hypothetical protein
MQSELTRDSPATQAQSMPRNRGPLQQETDVLAPGRVHLLRNGGQICRACRVFSLIAMFFVIIFAAAFAAAQEVQIGRDVTKLPPKVQRMRLAILNAATSGDVEELRVPIEMNEIHPIFTSANVADPIAYLKSVSADGNGRQILAILYNLLTTGYAIKNPRTKQETIVWPYHAVIPLDRLTPSQEVEIYRFLAPARVKDMAASGKYSFYRVEIGHDGVWHYFSSE